MVNSGVVLGAAGGAIALNAVSLKVVEGEVLDANGPTLMGQVRPLKETLNIFVRTMLVIVNY